MNFTPIKFSASKALANNNITTRKTNEILTFNGTSVHDISGAPYVLFFTEGYELETVELASQARLRLF